MGSDSVGSAGVRADAKGQGKAAAAAAGGVTWDGKGHDRVNRGRVSSGGVRMV